MTKKVFPRCLNWKKKWVSKVKTCVNGVSTVFQQSVYFFSVALLTMGKARVLILGHSFIRRFRGHITSSQDLGYNAKFAILTPEFICKWHGVGGRTIAKVVKYDLGVVKDFGPDIIILQLGSNDLVDSSALTVGSHLEDLVVLLHDHYKVDLI